MIKKTILLLPLLLVLASPAWATRASDSAWVDSVFRSLTLRQRIAQLMIIRAYSDRDSAYNDSLTGLIRQFNPGGVCFFKGTPHRQAGLTNRWQQTATTPLLIATDAEWGLGMRLDSAFSFPRPMTLGAINDDSLIYQAGSMIASACKRMGVHINFAPVADINNNPRNPVINVRSFGENRQEVARRAAIYMRGMQDQGIVATAKHFPGHGDTDTDSHLSLPVISHSFQRMDSVELFPFAELIRHGVRGIMIAHLFVPTFDSSLNAAATLSPAIVTGLLKERMGFKGFVITDALDMQGVTKYFKPGEIEVKALLAGNDILLLPQDINAAINRIEAAVDSGLLTTELIDSKCKSIVRLKFAEGLQVRPHVDTAHLYEDLNPEEARVLRKKIYMAVPTVLKNDIGLLPLTNLDRRKIATVSLGDSTLTPFQRMLSEYCAMDHYSLAAPVAGALTDSVLRQFRKYDFLVVGLHNMTSYPTDSFGLARSELKFLDTLLRGNRVVLSVFGNPYALELIPGCRKAEALLVTYQDFPESEEAAAQVILGGLPARGKLPVSAAGFTAGTGEETEKSRLGFADPEYVGIASKALLKVDSIVLEGIRARAYPGCQVLLARNGYIFYRKSFGTPRYEDTVHVTNRNLYDLASVTKLAATTLAVMKLADDGRLSLSDNLVRILPSAAGSNKALIPIRDIMAHQAGLQPWIPFYETTLTGRKPNPKVYRDLPDPGFPWRVANSLFIRKDYPDTIYQSILRSPLRSTREYKYSDLGFILLKPAIESVTGKSFSEFLDSAFYRPLGLQTLCFSPRQRFEPVMLMPTEYDTVFRDQLIRGDVHDPTAAMLGGIAGHAGLFSTSYDLAIVMQMLLQEGNYGGKQYITGKTVAEFTRVQFPATGNRRGAGFDKPLLNPAPSGPSCESASPRSFGHSGFTGTYTWADPDNNLVYVFLSNRVYPSASNQQLSEMNIRTRIHQAVYDLLNNDKDK